MGTLESNQELGVTEIAANKIRNLIYQDGPYSVIEVDAELKQQIDDRLDELKADNGTFFRMRPSKENDSIEAAVSAWRALHDPKLDRAYGGLFIKNVSPSFSHEIWYDEGFVRFHSYQPNQELADRFESKFRAKYGDVDISRPEKRYPTIEQGDSICAATVRTEREFWYPIKSPLTEGGDDSPVSNEDPYGDIATSMVLENDHHNGERLHPKDLSAMVQIVAEPARPCWTEDCLWGKDVSQVASTLKKRDIKIGKFGQKTVIEPSQQDKQAAKIVSRQRDNKGFYLTLRVITISEYPELAKDRARHIAEDYKKYFESFTLQKLEPNPLNEQGIREHFEQSLTRDHTLETTDRMTPFNPRKFLITAHGFGSLAHLPNDEINAPGIDWATMDTGPGAPADVEQADEIGDVDEYVGPTDSNDSDDSEKNDEDAPNSADTDDEVVNLLNTDPIDGPIDSKESMQGSQTDTADDADDRADAHPTDAETDSDDDVVWEDTTDTDDAFIPAESGNTEPVSYELPVDTPDYIPAILRELKVLRDRLATERFYARERDTLTEEVGAVLAEIGYHVDDSITLTWIEPYKKPTASKLAELVERYMNYLVPKHIPNWPLTYDECVRIQHAVRDVHDTMDDLPNFPFAYTELEVKERHGKDNLISVGIPDDVPEDEVDDPEEWYAGLRGVHAMSTNPRKDPSCALQIGTDTRTGYDVSVDKQNLFVHRAIFGQTGKGKSTLLTNNFRALMETGAGGCFIDPKGDDSKRLLQILPEDRLDDVIWIEPGATGEHISGFNFISTNVTPDSPNFDTIVSNLVEDMVKVLSAEDTWHTRMDRVARTLITVMNEYNRLTDDDTLDLNFVDMYYILKDEGSRNEFLALIEKTGIEFKAEYLDEIADMDDDMLEPLLGRFLKWIQEPTARRMIGFREESVNLSEAVEDDKIIIVRMGMENKRLKKMVGTAVIRRIWSHIRSRANKERYNRDPFYLFCDEFDNLVLQDDTIETMFSESRSYKLSLNCAMQYPSQVRDDVIDGVLNNAKTVHGFNPGRAKSARAFNTELGVDVDTLTDEADYHQWMRVDTNDGLERSDAFRVYTHPPFPPLRSVERAEEIRQRALREHGRETPSEQKEKARLLFNQGQGRWETGMGQRVKAAEEPEIKRDFMRQMLAQAPEPDELPIRDTAGGDLAGTGTSDSDTATFSDVAEEHKSDVKAETLDNILEATFAVRVQNGYGPDEMVPLEEVKEELRTRHGELGYISDLGSTLESAPKELLKQGQSMGEVSLKLKPKGRGRVLSHDSGSDSSGGGPKHRYLCGEAYIMASILGYDASIPSQDGAGEKPDATGESPVAPDDASSLSEMRELAEKLEREYPAVAELSDGRPLTMEIETSTFEKPIRTITNLRKAVNADRYCLFVVADGTHADDLPKTYEDDPFHYYAKCVERLFYDSTYRRTEGHYEIDRHRTILAKSTDEHGNRTFYNQGTAYRTANDNLAVRKEPDGRGDTMWKEDGDEIVARDKDNGELARFDTISEAQKGSDEKVTHLKKRPAEDDWAVIDGDEVLATFQTKQEAWDEWSTYKAPYIPDPEFNKWPSAEDYGIVVMPDDNNDRFNQPQLYVEGDLKPLYETLGDDLEPPAINTGDVSVSDGDTHDDTHDDTSRKESQSDSEETTTDDGGDPGDGQHNAPEGESGGDRQQHKTTPDDTDDRSADTGSGEGPSTSGESSSNTDTSESPASTKEAALREGTKKHIDNITSNAEPAHAPDTDEEAPGGEADTTTTEPESATPTDAQASTSSADPHHTDGTDKELTTEDTEDAPVPDTPENSPSTPANTTPDDDTSPTVVEPADLSADELYQQMGCRMDESERESFEARVIDGLDDPDMTDDVYTLMHRFLRSRYDPDEHGPLVNPAACVDGANPDKSYEYPETSIYTNAELRERLPLTENQRSNIGYKITEHTVKKVSDLSADEVERRELLRYYDPDEDDLGVEPRHTTGRHSGTSAINSTQSKADNHTNKESAAAEQDDTTHSDTPTDGDTADGQPTTSTNTGHATPDTTEPSNQNSADTASGNDTELSAAAKMLVESAVESTSTPQNQSRNCERCGQIQWKRKGDVVTCRACGNTPGSKRSTYLINNISGL